MGTTAIDIDKLLAEVERNTGLNDWGGNTFRHELESLAEEVCESMPTAFGLSEFDARIRRTLINRLSLVEDRKRYSDIARQQVRSPLVILGLPRTGTTFLHALLEQDPANRSVAEWEGMRPSPPPDAATYRIDPRRAASQAEMPDDPGWKQKHIHDTDLAIECGPAFFNYEFLTMGYDCRWRLPRYRERMKQSIAEAYRWHKQCLQHFQSRMPRERWVLRSPEHIAHIDELFATYPDVRVVFLHRDPLQVLGSLGSLVSFMRGPHYDVADQSGDARRTGIEMLDYWGHALDKSLAFRTGEEREVQFYDVAYRDLTADPMATVQGIYERFGLDLPRGSEVGMRAWLTDFRQDKYREKHGSHQYTPEEFGLSAREVQARFHAYKERYHLCLRT